MRFSVDDYLEAVEELEWLDDILIRVLILIPNRYFYLDEIDADEFQIQRSAINLVRQKLFSNAYRYDRNTRVRLHQNVKQYEESLNALALQKKSDLGLQLLYLDFDSKRQFLRQVIVRYRLLPHLIGEDGTSNYV